MVGYGQTRHEIFKRDKATTSLGQVSSEPLTWSDPDKVTATNASGALLAAGTGTGRLVWIKVLSTATTGVCINFGAAATTSDMPIEPGEAVFISTEQAINVIRLGALNCDVYVAYGVVG